MPEESLETQFARMSERMKFVLEGMEQDRANRKHQYEKLESINQTLNQFDGRMKAVENSLAKAGPTIEEFVTIKHKVVGAGLAGRWVWVLGSSLITYIFAARETIFKWLSS